MAVKKSYDAYRIDLFKNRKGEWIEMTISQAATFNMNEVAKCIVDKTYQGDFLTSSYGRTYNCWKDTIWQKRRKLVQ